MHVFSMGENLSTGIRFLQQQFVICDLRQYSTDMLFPMRLIFLYIFISPKAL